MLVPPTLPPEALVPEALVPLAMDPAGWLAPLGIAVLTFTLLRRYRVRSTQKPAVRSADSATAVREAARESAGTWELRLHDAGRAAEASLATRAAELDALAERADAAADRLRALPESREDGVLPLPTASLPTGDDRVRLHLRQAGYDDGQIDVILARDGDGERRRAA